jgi:hypothetical protein
MVALFTSWTIYALIVCGVGNVLLTQTAYQTGQPMITLPIIACVTPVASVAIGIGLLGETPHAGVAGGIAAGFAVLVTSVALAYLARSAPHPDPRAGSRPAPTGMRSPEHVRGTVRLRKTTAHATVCPRWPGRHRTDRNQCHTQLLLQGTCNSN